MKWRDLFPTRMALRLVEGSKCGMVLGDGARDRGARCEEITETARGVGYVVEAGSRAVTRVRAAYLTDDDIRQLAQTHRPGPVLHSGEAGRRLMTSTHSAQQPEPISKDGAATCPRTTLTGTRRSSVSSGSSRPCRVSRCPGASPTASG
ncbi:hypothetical protein [Prauserella muralis]|uniref:Uncharacterized protein n=1 Tax=Prauserella muralis TaxID=588067 RepID=A0A2V4BAQ7_9PSEU|nr:hypothetical protein [Prauserella muralis]PXY32378.1 hypothetical protein BAY60_08920 [Prauserella muralis]